MPDLFSMEQGSRQSSQITGDATGDVSAGTLAAQIAELASEKQARSEKGQANGYAPLGADSRLAAQYRPNPSGGFFPAANQAAMLALSTAIPGDTAIRSDYTPSRRYTLISADYTVLANWELDSNPFGTILGVTAGDVTGVTVTDGGAGNAGKAFVGDAAGKLDGRDVGADGSVLDAHVANASNPHSTTAAQVGADPVGTSATHAALTTAHGSTALNTASAIVQRDGSGGFAAGIATLTGEVVTLPADGDVLVDGRTNPRQITTGAMRFVHTPAMDGTRPVTLDIDATGYAVNGIEMAISTGAMAGGTTSNGLSLQVDKSQSTGGAVNAVSVNVTSGNGAAVRAVHVGAGVSPIHQEAGAEVGPTGYTYDGVSYTDVTASLASSAADATLFAANNDLLYLGHTATFGEIMVGLQTVASGPGIKPTFEFWSGAAWTVFAPSDGTNGFRQSGSISFTPANLTGWASTSVNGTSRYWIRITRTQNALTTPPVEDTIVIIAATSYGWDASGNITGRQFTSTVATGTAPGVVASTTLVDNLNADLLDGQHASAFEAAGAAATVQTNLTNHINEGTVNSLKKTGGAARTGVLSLTEGTNLTITDNGDGSFTLASTASGASATIDGVSNPGGDINLVQGTSIVITPDNGVAKSITIAADATATPTASKIPIADGSGKLAAGWGGSASTLATLDSSSKVVQNPASAQTAAGVSKIPISAADSTIARGFIATGAGATGYVPIQQSDGTLAMGAQTVQTSGGNSGGTGIVVYTASGAPISLAQNALSTLQIGSCSIPSVQVTGYYQGSGASNVVNSAWDFSTEASYTQEDGTSGTDFIDGDVRLFTATSPRAILLVHGDGSDGSVVIDDSSRNNFTGTVSGATISTTQSKWGGAAIKFTNDADYVQFGSSFILSGDFTIECWVYLTSVTGQRRISGTATGAKLQFHASGAGAYFSHNNSNFYNFGTFVINTWHHIRVTRSGSTVEMYLDNVLGNTQTISGSLGEAAAYKLGKQAGLEGVSGGYIDEFAIFENEVKTGLPSGAYADPSFPLTGYYAHIASSAKFPVSQVSVFDSMTITDTTPTNTQTRYLVSWDGAVTWIDHNGATVALADIHTSGSTKAQIQTYFTARTPPGGATSMQIAVGLKTTDATVTPTVSLISFQYDETTPWVLGINGTDYSARVWTGTNANVEFKSLRSGTATWHVRAEIV